ncbi:potassium channel family protein [Caulobacter sp. RHG1]|uniref:potassium channel family protein n=1 Tax=Caulobacter sp. (strain RHG1) TaxID=2545762 RepID=UPI00155705AC|nr:potassium channel family protein [Caulobacter sp. RHG1]NQE64293.1 Potassium voltage-gated channel subfamily KQT, possible potassium channel, VIC family [Caulobacter sp. RHG1]
MRRSLLLSLGILAAAFAAAFGMQQVQASLVVPVVAVALFVLVGAHLALFRYLVGSLSEKLTPDRLRKNLLWFIAFVLLIIAIYAGLYTDFGLKAGDTQVTDLGSCLYFSVIVWTTVGFGDITPATPLARTFAALEALNGALVMALFVATLIPTIQALIKAANTKPEA